MFTQENTSNIGIYIIYQVEDKYIKEDFQGLYEWFIRSKGDKNDFKCIHTQIVLSLTEKNKLRHSFSKILQNRSYIKTYNLEVKSTIIRVCPSLASIGQKSDLFTSLFTHLG